MVRFEIRTEKRYNDDDEMKERQRWQPEEDAILRAYVKEYGPKEWNLISQRIGKPLKRDPKSCLERWKNYLKPGIKKGSLTPDEQSLVICLQAKYGNKWKKIASEVPGRTAKRLGKWWEVFKEKQLKQSNKDQQRTTEVSGSNSSSPEKVVAAGRYDHILETFAEKYVQPKLFCFQSDPEPVPVLSLGSDPCSSIPSWMNNNTCSSSTSSTPSVSLSLSSPSEPAVLDMTRFIIPGQEVGTLIQYCSELEESRQNWLQHKKEATWRLSRLEQQLESEKTRKMREKMEQVEEKIRCLREEEMGFLGRIESEYREGLSDLQRDDESKESKLMEALCSKHGEFVKLVEQIGQSS